MDDLDPYFHQPVAGRFFTTLTPAQSGRWYCDPGDHAPARVYQYRSVLGLWCAVHGVKLYPIRPPKEAPPDGPSM